MAETYALTLSRFQFGDLLIEYLLAQESRAVGLLLYPACTAGSRVERREFLDTHEIRLQPEHLPRPRAWQVDSLVQVKLAGDRVGERLGGFSPGVSMRNSQTLSTLCFAGQEVLHEGDMTRILTRLRSSRGYACEHHLLYRAGDEAVTVQTVFCNEGQETLRLELLSSFSLGGLTPFAADDAPHRLHIHRFRSYWAAEGRHVSQPVEELHLEPSWAAYGVRSERFGQAGSLPVRGYFPFVGVEDRPAGVFWGAQMAWAGSWQMEVYRKDDQLCLSGGLADREFGHWVKEIAPGERLASPLAYVSAVQGDLDDLCQRLTAMQSAALQQAPASENSLPVLANEWCTTWGSPDHDRVVALADRLSASGAKYLVIDAGWYKGDQGDWFISQGEWQPNKGLFPHGIAATAAAIRQRGLIPGIWFEFEVLGSQSPLFNALAGHVLHRDGMPVVAGERRFFDFRDPWVHAYLREKVITFLQEAGFGYIKVDYNETIGIGVDGAESLGEGLRQHITGVQEFFQEMRRALPELVIEVCSSGGHRLEPSMLALASMGSFSDAHESLEIPIIAANLQRLILPQQSQIWAVLHAGDSMSRLAYSLAAGFLGRLCLSGEIDRLDAEQWRLVQAAIDLYGRVAPIIKHGRSRLVQQIGAAWRHPQGVQAVVRASTDGSQLLIVLHSFGEPVPLEFNLPLPDGDWQVAGTFPAQAGRVEIGTGQLHFKNIDPFEGRVIHLADRSLLPEPGGSPGRRAA